MKPFDQGQPAITPKSTPGGGDARPPYLQTRTAKPQVPKSQGFFGSMLNGTPRNQQRGQTTPVVTPKSTAMPGEVKSPIAANPIGLGSSGAKPPQAGGQNLADVYKFFQSDLENEKNQALASTRSDAANRGVFYGSPLTGSEADINTQYLRGLGQFQAGMFGNQQQNELQRLQLAMGLTGQNQQGQPPMPAPIDLSAIGSIFGAQPAVSGKRQGPVPKITPKNDAGDKIKQPTDVG